MNLWKQIKYLWSHQMDIEALIGAESKKRLELERKTKAVQLQLCQYHSTEFTTRACRNCDYCNLLKITKELIQILPFDIQPRYRPKKEITNEILSQIS